MTKEVVRQAQQHAQMLRRTGYPDAHAADEYCIEEIGPDKYYTKTVCVYVGEYDESSIPRMVRALHKVMQALK